jgi:hypothetical protein
LRLNIICGNRTERLPRLYKELETQGITDYEFWPGIYLPSIKASINAAHKQIVRYAQLAGWDEVAIAEDDLIFSSPYSWIFFLDKKPNDFDLYLSMIYLGTPNENNEVKDFTGLTMYIVKSKFYEKFLSVPDDDHLDILLAGLGKYVVCHPFVAKQSNGFSSNTGKEETYDDLLKNRTFL